MVRISHLLTVMHGSNPGRKPIVLELASDEQRIALFADVPLELKATFVEVLQDGFPGMRLTRAEPTDAPSSHTSFLTFAPDTEYLIGAQRLEGHSKRATDPLSVVLSQLRNQGDSFASVKISLKPVSRRRRRIALRHNQYLIRRFPLQAMGRLHRRFCTQRTVIAQILAILLRIGSQRRSEPVEPGAKLRDHLFDASLQISASGANTKNLIVELVGAFSQFTSDDVRLYQCSVSRVRSVKRRHYWLLTPAEASMLWHPPPRESRIAKLERASSRQWEPPSNLARATEQNSTTMGRVQFRGSQRKFAIRSADLLRHMFVCGRTGSGKSTLIQTMAIDDIEKGSNVVVIDPHGDLVESIADQIPGKRTNDVVYLRVSDRERPVSFNPLACVDPAQRPIVADNVVSALKRLYGDSWGPRLEQILRNACLAVLETRQPTLLSVQQMLTLRDHRREILGKVEDPIVRSFWLDTFGQWNDRFRNEAVSPVLNKLDAFLSNPITRAIVGDPRKPIDIRQLLDAPNTILLCDLSKGLIGEQSSSLIGALLVSAIQTAALGRANVPESKRRPVHCYIDEFHAFVSEGNSSFATILSESRKYKVAFAALATQYLEQIDSQTLAAVLGNAGSAVVFRSGVRDAGILSEHLGGDVTADQITNLSNYTAYAKLLIDGEPSREPFSMATTPTKRAGGRGEIVKRVSRTRWGTSV